MNITKLEQLVPEILEALVFKAYWSSAGMDKSAAMTALAEKLRAALSEPPEGKVVPVDELKRVYLHAYSVGFSGATKDGAQRGSLSKHENGLIAIAALFGAAQNNAKRPDYRQIALDLLHGDEAHLAAIADGSATADDTEPASAKPVMTEERLRSRGVAEAHSPCYYDTDRNRPINAAETQESTHQAVENAISAAKVKDHKWGESPASAAAPTTPSKLPLSAQGVEFAYAMFRDGDDLELDQLRDQAIAAIKLEKEVWRYHKILQEHTEAYRMLEQRVAEQDAEIERLKEGPELWRQGLNQKPMHCACKFEWRPTPDLSGAPPVLLEECGYHANRKEKAERELAELKHDIERHVQITTDQANEIAACQQQLREALKENVMLPRNGYSYERIWCRSCLKATKYVRIGNDLLCEDCKTIHCSFHAPEATADDVKEFLERKNR